MTDRLFPITHYPSGIVPSHHACTTLYNVYKWCLDASSLDCVYSFPGNLLGDMVEDGLLIRIGATHYKLTERAKELLRREYDPIYLYEVKARVLFAEITATIELTGSTFEYEMAARLDILPHLNRELLRANILKLKEASND